MHTPPVLARPRAVALAVAAFALCIAQVLHAVPAAAAERAAARAPTLAIVGVRILPSPDAPTLEDGTVVLREGRIVAVGPRRSTRVPRDALRIDGRDATLVAGFWNSHVHLLHDDFIGARATPAARLEHRLRETFTRRGFTTVFDIASRLDDALAVRARIESGEVAGPRILTVGDPFYPEGGTPIYVRDLYRRHGFASGEVATPAAARERAEAQLARGADGVKIFTGAILGGPGAVMPMPTPIAAAAAAPPRAAGLPVFAHPTDLRGLGIAIDAGATVLAHTTPGDGTWPDEVVQRVVAQRVALVPTLTLFEVELVKDGVPKPIRDRLLAAAQQQVRALVAAGGDVLFGTDVGYIDEADTTIELQLLAAAGLDARAILRTLTTAPATRFDRARRAGTIATGAPADLVLLGGDPEQRIEAFAAVRCTIRDGRIVYGEPACAVRTMPRDSDAH